MTKADHVRLTVAVDVGHVTRVQSVIPPAVSKRELIRPAGAGSEAAVLQVKRNEHAFMGEAYDVRK